MHSNNHDGSRAGGFNGDLHATLIHDSGEVVLLNRPGRRANNLSGYGDSGMNVTFSDSSSRNIHEYRLELNGNHTDPVPGGPTGIWVPDGRGTDPDLVLDTDDPTQKILASFNGLDPNGSWTIKVADFEGGGLSRLDSWGLEISGASPVPEPEEWAMIHDHGYRSPCVRRRATQKMQIGYLS